MNYGQLRDFALQLIRQYSNAGTLYAPSYNGQQDYLNAIPNLVNDALLLLAESYRPREAIQEYHPCDGTKYGGYLRFVLPEDLLEVKTNGLLVLDKNIHTPEAEYIRQYKLQLPDYILLPNNIEQPFVMEYYRRPQLVAEKPKDTDPIDATAPEQHCIAHYVAAMLVMQDDAFAYASLYNEFATRAANLAPAISAEVTFIADDYGGPHYGLGGVSRV